MTEPLTVARFQELAEAYGGVVARWPEQYRGVATAMASRPDARDILERASALDGVLDTWRVQPSARSLHERVIATAPVPSKKFMARARLWWSGAGLVAALAGATAGTAAVAIAAPVDAISDSGTSFGDVAGSET